MPSRRPSRKGRLRAEHLIHLRCEVSADNVLEHFADFENDPYVRLVSLMDHAPGQRQFQTMDQYIFYYQKKRGLSDDEFAQFIEKRFGRSERNSTPHRIAIAKVCAERGITVASHDDATIAACRRGDRATACALAEFPTSFDAAKASHEHGMSVLMGAPNIVRGKSHSGNIAARDLAERGVLDVLSSDYVPLSLLYAPFIIADEVESISLPKAIAMVTATPARTVSLDDRGRIAAGLRADLVRVYPRPRRSRHPLRLARRAPRRMMPSHEPHVVPGSERGIMVVVVGPSGAGKDTLMALAAKHFGGRPDVHFVRRVITRDGEAGEEHHLAVSDAGLRLDGAGRQLRRLVGSARPEIRHSGGGPSRIAATGQSGHRQRLALGASPFQGRLPRASRSSMSRPVPRCWQAAWRLAAAKRTKISWRGSPAARSPCAATTTSSISTTAVHAEEAERKHGRGAERLASAESRLVGRAMAIVVVPYDPKWPDLFEAARAELLDLAADRISRRSFHHIGSTSVPGLAGQAENRSRCRAFANGTSRWPSSARLLAIRRFRDHGDPAWRQAAGPSPAITIAMACVSISARQAIRLTATASYSAIISGSTRTGRQSISR